MAALRQANSKNLGLADRQLSGKLYVSIGRAALSDDRQLSGVETSLTAFRQ